MKSLT